MDSDFLGAGVENYRGFRYNWTGIPNEAPAIVALKDGKTGTTNIYVSWNGDTCTKKWRFYEIDDSGRSSYLGESSRQSFETVLELKNAYVRSVQAEALNANGELLVRTSRVQPAVHIHEFKEKGRAPQREKGFLPWLKSQGQKFLRVDGL
jgi:hypothetical protein